MKSTASPARRAISVASAFGFTFAANAATIISDGSDGSLNGGGTLTLDADGVLNFTAINIRVGATLRFTRNAANTPVVLAATGDVTIEGASDISAGHFSGVAGPGGGDGGMFGNGAQNGLPGGGPSPGQGGLYPGDSGNADGLSTEPLAFDPFFYSSGPNGGHGYVQFSAANVMIDPGANTSAKVVPVPASIPLPASSLMGLGLVRRRKPH